MATQVEEIEPVHVHSRAAETFTSPIPPVALKLEDELDSETWQRVAVGPVTFVVAELPQA